MGRQLRSPLTLAFEIDAPVVYETRSGTASDSARFVVQAGHNTVIIMKKDVRPVLAHRDQLRPLPVSEQGSSAGQDYAAITAKLELPELLPRSDATDEPEDRRTTETDSGDGVPQKLH